jgi:hypothetical protein
MDFTCKIKRSISSQDVGAVNPLKHAQRLFRDETPGLNAISVTPSENEVISR